MASYDKNIDSEHLSDVIWPRSKRSLAKRQMVTEAIRILQVKDRNEKLQQEAIQEEFAIVEFDYKFIFILFEALALVLLYFVACSLRVIT